MKFEPIDPPRVFQTGRGTPIAIRDCGRVTLEPDEQVTFITPQGAEYDVARKTWGFYATPSLNGRLSAFGLRAVLVRSLAGKFYLFLVEAGRELDFEAYLEREENTVVRWLDNDDDLSAIAPSGVDSGWRRDIQCVCRAPRLTTVHMYFSRPSGEVPDFRTVDGGYRREIFECSTCGHFVSAHAMGQEAFYRGGYVDVTYGDAEGMRRTFARIVGLPEERSDNAGRVARVLSFMRGRSPAPPLSQRVLDIGSGLCVFLHLMKASGWDCTALDPDPRAAAHARDHVGVTGVSADFFEADDLGQFELITFNKVLEHVKDPIAMLRRASRFLSPGGVVYLELPDGEAARRDPLGFDREEFFIEHEHVFSAASVALLARRAGFDILALERLREPSTKYTLRVFLRTA